MANISVFARGSWSFTASARACSAFFRQFDADPVSICGQPCARFHRKPGKTGNGSILSAREPNSRNIVTARLLLCSSAATTATEL